MEINSNVVTASGLLKRALYVADIANTDFLSYEEKIRYLNDCFKNVYQTIIQYNLNVFTVEANLIGSGGVYKLPWDCYQLKSVKNPITGIEIPRRADSESIFGGTYELVNDTIRLGPCVGPITITYWRKPFFLSVPDETRETLWTLKDSNVLSVCKDTLLVRDRTTNTFSLINTITDSKLDLPIDPATGYNGFYLGNNFIVCTYYNNLVLVYDILDFEGNVIHRGNFDNNYVIKADDGMLYFGTRYDEDPSLVHITYPDGIVVGDKRFPTTPDNIICIDNEFYSVQTNAMPIGLFDERPAYTTARKLHLINVADDRTKDIVEDVSVPSIGNIVCTKYGFLDFTGKLFSNVPDTELNFPSNLYYDCMAYDLAVRFLCKMNADSSGVENLNRNAWTQLTASIDQSADFPRIKLVRR